MLVYLNRRLIQALVTAFILAVIVFMLVRLAPGDPARLLLPQNASEEAVSNLRMALGLDKPILTQFGIFLRNLSQGDLGKSIWYNEDVISVLLSRIPYTLELGLFSWFIASMIGIPLGVLAAVRQGTLADLVISSFAALGIAMPNFWVGIMAILFLSVKMHIFPSHGAGTALHLILPGFVLAIQLVSFTSRITKSSLLEVLRKDYIRTAQAKGVREGAVIWKHALRNALAPVITVIGLQLGANLGTGMVITESVFEWPGVGRLIVASVFARDYPVIQGAVLGLGIVFLLLNILIDVLYAVIDPRIRYS